MRLDEGIPLEREKDVLSPQKNVFILPILARILCKRLQISTDMLLIITSTDNELHKGVNIDDLEPL